ncbi:hypothetical protein BJ546DRAFT_969402 [Cryomyces antarcticus]
MNRKRKAEDVLHGRPQVSAFAAAARARAPWNAPPPVPSSSSEGEQSTSSDEDDDSKDGSGGEIGQENSNEVDREITGPFVHVEDRTGEPLCMPALAAHHEEYDTDLDDKEFAQPLPPPKQQLCSWQPNARNVLSKPGDNAWVIVLEPLQTIVLIGQYDLLVRKTPVTVYGATLRPSSTLYSVFAPSTHALPIILNPFPREAELEFWPPSHSLRLLEKLSPLYGRIWNYRIEEPETRKAKLQRRTYPFSYLHETSQDPLKRPLYLLENNPSWQVEVGTICASAAQRTPLVMVCGPKGSGKSTFSRMLLNRLLTDRPPTKPREVLTGFRSAQDPVFYLDLDPGQPEFSPQGQLSLLLIREPVLGPPYTHPLADCLTANQTVRAHSIASTNPKNDPIHFVTCALDLVTRYRQMLQDFPSSPLIVNCPGWILGSALEVTTDLIRKLSPTNVVYTSQSGPADIVRTLAQAAGQSVFNTVSSQMSAVTVHTSAQLRDMQTLSYFHTDTAINGKLRWNAKPLTSAIPWKVSYGEDNPGIIGVMSYGEYFHSEFLSTVLNGTLVAVVVIESNAAFGDRSPLPETESIADDEVQDDEQQPTIQLDGGGLRSLSQIQAQLSEMNSAQAVSQVADQVDTPPTVLRTEKENLPYIPCGSSGYTKPLDPRYSHTIGMALVRSIDVSTQTLLLLTPMSKETINGLYPDCQVVLVRGRFDTPSWSYTEKLSLRQHEKMRRRRRMKRGVEDVEESDEDEEDSIPWVSQSKTGTNPAGGQVWRSSHFNPRK